MMKKKNYSDTEIEKMFQDKEELLKFRSNYSASPYCFFVLQEDGKTSYANSHCAESTLAYVGQIFQYEAKKRFIGITMLSTPASLVSVQRESNLLHDTERKFGIARHNLRCLSMAGDTAKVLWVFELGKKWYTAPPVLSLCLGLIRGSLKNLSTGRKSNHLYNLLLEKSPHSLFGASRAVNWGKGNTHNHDNTRFNSTYGIMSLNRNLKDKNRTILDVKFPKHKLFGDTK